MKLNLKTLALAAALAASAPAMAVPTNFSFNGTFNRDDNVQLFNFTSDGSSTAYIVSYAYGGGTQANGDIWGRGGFDTILTLFDASGNQIASNDDGSGACFTAATGVAPGTDNGNVDPVTGRLYDTCFSAVLAAGSYTVAVTQYDNFSNGTLASGFQRDGQGNFTAGAGWRPGCANVLQFCDATGNARTNVWAYDILNVADAGRVPEPASLALVGLALAGLGLSRRARKA